ncbi:hypothetical protein Ppro_0390 [Pelobacter propionicus DSM 2379]|uniref:Uncharacterized protein n=1 Tax=Pelobacter propionicus (strain DSM 2379 / NBRC 103807 / OttBd1) TaxID=338966 RepID=A1AL04_PELPD|nr:hypothetical protein Ppro_0390 [Pelobacter propionicus DSM 2379]
MRWLSRIAPPPLLEFDRPLRGVRAPVNQFICHLLFATQVSLGAGSTPSSFFYPPDSRHHALGKAGAFQGRVLMTLRLPGTENL